MMKAQHIILLGFLLLIACGGSDPARAGIADEGGPKGQQVYRMYCELCHGADGKLGFNGAKDLTVSTTSRAEMIMQVTQGKGKMMPYKDVLTAKEIEAVVDYSRTLGKAR
jgi:cytochrome c6